jgi:NitT/TauT family transport system substrate-binding protein
MVMAWIDKNGGSSSKVKFVELPFPQMEAALSAGKVDAISIHEPFATAALKKGNARLLAQPWGDVLPKFLIASWFASEKWIAKNRSTVQAFVRAIDRGIDAIQADPEGSRAAMVKWAGLSPELAGKIGLPVFEKGISEKDIQATIDLTRKYKLISKDIKAASVVSDLAKKN